MSAGDDWETPLPKTNRYITEHDDQGKSVFSKELEEPLKFFTVPVGNGHTSGFELGYSTTGMPITLANDQDLKEFKESYANKLTDGLIKSGGTILRFVDIPPGVNSPMHRTVSLDLGIVIHGKVTCKLDSGEKRVLGPGDLMVQRGTMHEWVNEGAEWVRLAFVQMHSTPIVVNGETLGEDVGGMDLKDSH